MTGANQFSTFYLDGQWFGVDVLDVREVIRHQEVTRVPLAPAAIRGLINIRGQVVTAIDLRHRLELSPRNPQQLPMNVVVRTDDGATSLLVDDIGDVVRVTEDSREAPPQTLRGAARELIKAVYKLSDRLLLVLDTEKASSVPAGARRSGERVD
ncbi:MAG: purine-binding chemotaxis protein CheW [Planctomycetes bacterium]|nr:purine-binding chemotaxis protein CheW [Planctomycetota bacterium]MBI3843008.1 purine-binding chemotaxis protein CheW [Planctomycetota bacterium]